MSYTSTLRVPSFFYYFHFSMGFPILEFIVVSNVHQSSSFPWFSFSFVIFNFLIHLWLGLAKIWERKEHTGTLVPVGPMFPSLNVPSYCLLTWNLLLAPTSSSSLINCHMLQSLVTQVTSDFSLVTHSESRINWITTTSSKEESKGLLYLPPTNDRERKERLLKK